MFSYESLIILKNWSPLIRWRCLVGLDYNATVVATNGCFDILHAGHVHMLEEAKKLGDFLVVGVNSDWSVKQLKGPTRPINNQDNRKKVLESLRCVDFVHIFDEVRATRFLKVAAPNVYVKAADYNLDNMDKEEHKVLDQLSARIFTVPFIDGLSTTKTIQKL